MNYRDILFSKSERIATITLNRPDQRNIIGHQMMDELLIALKDIADDKDVRVVILTAAGDTFSAGADVKEFFEKPIEQTAKGESNVRPEFFSSKFIPLMVNLGKPVIAAINGLAAGLGCTICLTCDMRLASSQAKFNLGFVRLGLTPEMGSTFFLPRLIGPAKTLEILYTGKTVEAREAKEIGLVNEVVQAERLVVAAHEIARTIAGYPASAIRLIREGIYQGMFTDVASALKWENVVFDYSLSTEDHAIAVKDLIEKHKTDYKGP